RATNALSSAKWGRSAAIAGNASPVSGGRISRSSAATAAELNRRPAPFGPVLPAAAEHRPALLAGCRDHARRDRRSRAAGADRDDRPVLGQVVEALANDPVREVPRPLDVALVALGLLSHVEHLDVVLGQEALEVLDL